MTHLKLFIGILVIAILGFIAGLVYLSMFHFPYVTPKPTATKPVHEQDLGYYWYTTTTEAFTEIRVFPPVTTEAAEDISIFSARGHETAMRTRKPVFVAYCRFSPTVPPEMTQNAELCTWFAWQPEVKGQLATR